MDYAMAFECEDGKGEARLMAWRSGVYDGKAHPGQDV